MKVLVCFKGRVIKLGKINEGYYGVYRLKWSEYKSTTSITLVGFIGRRPRRLKTASHLRFFGVTPNIVAPHLR